MSLPAWVNELTILEQLTIGYVLAKLQMAAREGDFPLSLDPDQPGIILTAPSKDGKGIKLRITVKEVTNEVA